jgi:beta-lactamase superfamily II metal-dependent hydrolase
MACKYVNAAMKRKGLTAIVQRRGDIINLGSVKFECIAPINYSDYSANRNSLNHLVTFGSTTLLLTGDYMDSDALLSTYSADKLNVYILKYPHHGNYKITEQLFNALSPAYVIAQNDNDELGRNAAASKRLIEKSGAKLYQNYSSGNIVVISDGKNIEVRTKVDPKTFK